MNFKKKKGIALISVLLLLVAFMVLTMGFVHYTMQDYLIGRTYHQANVCFYLASAELEYTKYLVKHNLLLYPYAPYRDDTTTSGSFEEEEEGRDGSVGGDGNNDFDDDSNAGFIDYTKSYDPADPRYNLPMRYDANNFDGVSAVHNVGDIINVYDGHEHLLIQRLTFGSDGDTIVGKILERGNTCGTFKISVVSQVDPNGGGSDYRVLIVKSEGLVKRVPSADWPNAPSTWDVGDKDKYEVVSKRTLLMRIPYQINNNQFYIPSDDLEILSDSWWEKFR